MANVLFLSVPAHGNVNPTLGLVSELIKRGETVTYFSSDIFKSKIEATGATYKRYNEDLDIFKVPDPSQEDPMLRVIRSTAKIVDDILAQIEGVQFDYLIHSAAFPFTKIIAPIVRIPTVSSLAIFAGLSDFFAEEDQIDSEFLPQMVETAQAYEAVSQAVSRKYGVQLPENFLHLLLNKGTVNLVYTSEYFIDPADRTFFDGTYKFVGPPVYERKENLDFPFEKLAGKQVIYISLGTVFGNYNLDLYDIFFKSFADSDVVVVLAAYQVDLSRFIIPNNFIVRDYVPQSAVLKHTNVAITHAGMNSISDLVHSHIPFVCIPLGADQPNLAKRAEELGATISLDATTLTPDKLKTAVDKVLNDPTILENMGKINKSFQEAGGYPKAVDAIFAMKQEKGIAM